MNNLMNTAFDAVHLAKGLAADAAPGIMNTVKNATLASVTIAKDAINSTELRENVHAGLVAAAAKTQELVEAAPDAAGQGAEWAAANPGTAALLAVGAVGVGLVAAPMVAAGPVMAATGFSSVGPVAGSVAAGVQAAAGNVVAGGVYATVQSAAMGGYGVAAVSGAVQGVGAVMASGAGGTLIYQNVKEGDETKKSD